MINKTRLIVATILILVLTYGTGLAGLEVKITPLKAKYLLLEPILVYYQVKNIGPDTARFRTTEIPNNFIVLDSRNKRYYPLGRGSYVGPPPPFKQGESVEKITDLRGYGTLSSRIGKYRVYLEIEYYGEDKVSKSNTIEFEIIEPIGKEKEAFGELLAVDSLISQKNVEAAYKKLVSIYRNYPTSVYTPFCLSRALSLYDGPDKSEKVKLSREFIEKYPDSHFIYKPLLILLDYYRSKRDKDGYHEELKSLIQKYPGTEVARQSKERLENLDKVKF